MTSESSEYREQRLANMAALAELGIAPFGGAYERSGNLAQIRAEFTEGVVVKAAGRLMTIRNMGKSIFADLYDGRDRFQIYVQRKMLGDAAFDAFKLLDSGDQVGVEGELFVTRSGEQTLKVKQWTMLAKALQPLPEKFHGLKDVDTRYRRRYLDLLANHEVRLLFDRRIEAVKVIREFLTAQDFQEVETPMMQAIPGGAAARPFVTHYSALGTDMYLRIAPELYLKRLLVGGFDKVFELNRNFRNEGLDRTHNPEFTMLEIYEAYGDVESMKRLIEGLITRVAQDVFGSLRVGRAEHPVDLTPPWRDVTYAELVKEQMGLDWYDLSADDAREKALAAGLDIPDEWDHLLITHEVYEKLIEKTLQQPTFVRRLPAALVPLAGTCADDQTCADVFELVIGGQEVAPAYSEMNDPVEQCKRLQLQSGGDAARLDADFIEALEYGMPPAGGMGVGIDRLIMIMSGSEAIRDVILFPQLRPHGRGEAVVPEKNPEEKE